MTSSGPLPDQPARPVVTWRTGVWLLLVVAAVGNTVTSLASAPIAVQVVLGVVAGACAALLVVDHLRRR